MNGSLLEMDGASSLDWTRHGSGERVPCMHVRLFFFFWRTVWCRSRAGWQLMDHPNKQWTVQSVWPAAEAPTCIVHFCQASTGDMRISDPLARQSIWMMGGGDRIGGAHGHGGRAKGFMDAWEHIISHRLRMDLRSIWCATSCPCLHRLSVCLSACLSVQALKRYLESLTHTHTHNVRSTG